MNLTDHRIEKIIRENGGNFTAPEFLPGRSKLNARLIKEVVQFRNWHGYSSYITSAYRDKGAHSIGAIDKILYSKWKQEQPEPIHLWRIATTWPWMGVGIYFDWTHDGRDVVGLHLDIVQPKDRNRPLRWIRAEGDYYYQSLINGRFYNTDKGVDTTLEKEIAIWKQDNGVA